MCKHLLSLTALRLFPLLSIIILGSLCISPRALAGEQTVYICERDNGETLMQDTKPSDCTHLKTVQIKINTDENNSQSAVRFDENARYNNPYHTNHKTILIQDNLHNRLLQQSQDDYYVNQCYWYGSKIQNELLEIDRRPEDALEVRQIMAQIPKDKAQYEYYCNQPYSK